MGPRLRECCRQGQVGVVSKSSNKIHQTGDRLIAKPFTVRTLSHEYVLYLIITVFVLTGHCRLRIRKLLLRWKWRRREQEGCIRPTGETHQKRGKMTKYNALLTSLISNQIAQMRVTPISSVTFYNWPPAEKGSTSSNQLISFSLTPSLSSFYSFSDQKQIPPVQMLGALDEVSSCC